MFGSSFLSIFLFCFVFILNIDRKFWIHKKKFRNISDCKTFSFSAFSETLHKTLDLSLTAHMNSRVDIFLSKSSVLLLKSLQGLFAFSFLKMISSLLSIDRRVLEALRFFPCAAVTISSCHNSSLPWALCHRPSERKPQGIPEESLLTFHYCKHSKIK